jgi:hypothetical protein
MIPERWIAIIPEGNSIIELKVHRAGVVRHIDKRSLTLEADILQTTSSFRTSVFLVKAALTQIKDGCILDKESLNINK